LEKKWKNKIAAGFTVGASTSGDKLNSLIQLSVFAAQHGMIWVGQSHVGSKNTKDGKKINDVGSWLGLSATSNPDKSKMIYEHDALTARLFGQRIAHISQKWKSVE
jgi:NAD(P)H dehydrogenase (quinone)